MVRHGLLLSLEQSLLLSLLPRKLLLLHLLLVAQLLLLL